MFCTHDNSFKSLQTAAYIAVDKLKNLNLCSFVPLCSFFPSNSTTLCGSSATINQDCLMLILPFERVSCDSKKACILLHISFIYIFIVRGWHLSFFIFLPVFVKFWEVPSPSPLVWVWFTMCMCDRRNADCNDAKFKKNCQLLPSSFLALSTNKPSLNHFWLWLLPHL